VSLVLEAVGQLLASPHTLFAIALGTITGLMAGLTPGVSGRTGLVLVTPIAMGLGPTAGALFLIAFHGVVHTSGSIPAILLGTPTSSAEAATAIDGFAMARKGQGAQAIGASLGASAIGGLMGALFLFGSVPAALSIITHFGTPEITALSVLGLLSISALSGGWLTAGLMVAAIGILIGAVGVDPMAGAARGAFGVTALWDGVSAAALVTGLFVAPELLSRDRTEPLSHVTRPRLGDVLAGARNVLAQASLAIRSGLVGILVGIIPGLGTSVAVWMAYGHARQTHPSDVPYGEGAIAGVIAPEAANNSKEGGALVPTLFLAIPASSGMGILLACFATLGVEVGPRLLSDNPLFLFQLGWSNILANLLALPICLLVTPLLARISQVRREQVIPLALAAALTATVLTDPSWATLGQILAFSVLGILLKAANLPRAPLLLGFVLGPGLESGLMRSAMVYGWQGLMRPGVLIILALALVAILASARARLKLGTESEDAATTALPLACAAAAALCLMALVQATVLPPTAAGILILAGSIGLATSLVTLWRFWPTRAAARKATGPDPILAGMGLGGLGLAGLVALPAAIGILVAASTRFWAKLGWRATLFGALACAAAAYGLEQLIR
jgi:hypothetical protein